MVLSDALDGETDTDADSDPVGVVVSVDAKARETLTNVLGIAPVRLRDSTCTTEESVGLLFHKSCFCVTTRQMYLVPGKSGT